MRAKPSRLSGRQLWQSLRVGVVITRNPLAYVDAQGRLAVAPNRKERRDAACRRGVERMKPERLEGNATCPPPHHPAKLRARTALGAR